MKRASSPAFLFSRDFPFLPWWQEIILNWVASWPTIGLLLVTSPDGQDQAEWDVPSDLELDRLELEAQWENSCRDS